MIKTLSYLFFGMLNFFAVAFCLTVIDDAQQTIQLVEPAKRIISLSPDLTEDLFYIGAGSHVVGVIQGSDYPAEARNLPIVATYNSVDSEKILALQPDLIIAWSDTSLIPAMNKLGIPVYISHPQLVNDIAATLIKLGQLTGRELEAIIRAEALDKNFDALRIHYENKKVVSVFYQVWSNPLLTINGQSWISSILSLCGGKNIFSSLKGRAPEINIEDILIRNPDIIIATSPSADLQAQWQRWKELTAVKNNALLTVNADTLERASPRLLLGAKELCVLIDSVRESVVHT